MKKAKKNFLSLSFLYEETDILKKWIETVHIKNSDKEIDFG